MGTDILPVLAQVISAAIAGFILGYVVIATRNIWVACLVHAFYNTQDYISEFSTTFFEKPYSSFIEAGAVIIILVVIMLLFKKEYWKAFSQELEVMVKA